MYESVLGQPLVARLTAAASRNRLRVIAYHDVPDRQRFREHLTFFRRNYHVVSGPEVRAAIRSEAELPPRSLWITFDDGRRGVVEHGLPELCDAGMAATLFVCPDLVEHSQPFWWSIVEAALREGPIEWDGATWTDRTLVTRLKTRPDTERRAFMAQIGPRPTPPADRSLDRDGLSEWLAAGFEVGNHTWDHPCLDLCDAAEQRRQITEAHDWLVDLLGTHPRVFVYPNGDFTGEARSVLTKLGYQLALMFDHRLADVLGDPMRISRLRLDADADPARLRAIVSGAHPAIFHLTRSRRAG